MFHHGCNSPPQLTGIIIVDAHAGTDQSGKSIHGGHRGLRLFLLLS
jgi:hypothetical protein